MSSSNNRFGRRMGGQKDDLRAEPVLSFNPKRAPARGTQNDAAPSVNRTTPSAPRVDRADAEEFGARFGRDPQRDPIPSFMRGSEPGPRVDRADAEEFGMSPKRETGPRIGRDDEDFDPRRGPREKAKDSRTPDSERPLYHHLFEDEEPRGHRFGWIAALGSVAVVAVGAVYVWHNFMSRPAPGNLLDPPGYAARGPGTGYTTPTQPTTNADKGQDLGSAPSPLASTPPASTDTPAPRDVAEMPQPKDVPAEPPPPPKKTISEVAANPGNLGAPVNPPPTATQPAVAPAPVPPPPPPAATQPAVAPAPVLTPPPKREATKSETPKREAPRKQAAISPPKPTPAPAPEDTAPLDMPPAVTQPAAAPAASAPPRPRAPSQATGQPQQLNRNAPAAYPPPPQQPAQQQQQQPSFATRSPPPMNAAPNAAPTNLAPNYGAPNAGPNYAAPNNMGQNKAGPQPGAPDTVTVDGVNYVNGQEPRSLGTLSGQPQAASSDAAPMPPSGPTFPMQSPPSRSTRYYAPTDHDGGAPLPNDVIILPNGQMAVPNDQR